MLYALYSLENRNIIEYGGVSMKIFIIEDEPAIREELVQLLQKYGYQCDSSDDFHHIVQAALSSGANLILLDINLPYQDGFQVCREIRQKSNLPIIVPVSYTHLVVPEIFFCQTFQPLVLPRGHAGPCAGDFIGQDGVLLALLHSALLPFVR